MKKRTLWGTVRLAEQYLLVWVGLSAGLLLTVGCTASPATSPPLNGGQLATYQMNIDLPGARREVPVDIRGRLKTKAAVSSADGRIHLSLEGGTLALDKEGKPLRSIQAATDSTLPLPPGDAYIIGALYDLRPTGATFDPPIMLTLSYDPGELPEGVRESDVYIAPYDERAGWGEWGYRSVDAKNHRVTAMVTHLTRYAVLAPTQMTSVKPPPKPSSQQGLASIPLGQALSSGKPTLAEFGANTCIPCKQMKPILEDLALQYQGRVNVVIVEVYEHKDLVGKYRIMTIPTQIVFDSGGKEVTRHIGLWPKKEIIAQLKKLGMVE